METTRSPRIPENAQFSMPMKDMTPQNTFFPPNSFQQTLINSIGEFVLCDFLIGDDSIVRKEGILYSVGPNTIILFDSATGRYIVCDYFSLRFVSLFGNGRNMYQQPTVPKNPFLQFSKTPATD